MSIRQGNNWIAGSGSGATDNTSISKNTSNQLQAIGTKNKNAATGALDTKYDWVGTLAEFNQQNIAYDHPEWICYVTDDVSGGYSVYTKNESDARYLNNNQITNCITEIPQDIKLELNDGTLTLKAGSKVYIPNGFEQDGTTPKFDVVIIDIDKSVTPTNTGSNFVVYWDIDGTTSIINVLTQLCASGTSSPGTGYFFWYDTTNNKIKYSASGNNTWVETMNVGLPFCLGTTSVASGMTSIDQVFNGFGYIGSTIFALPGVKGLIPNGRNEDGTLNNISVTVNSVKTITRTDTRTATYFGIREIDFWISAQIDNSVTYYNDEENIFYSNNKPTSAVICGTFTCSSGKITSMIIKTVFHAIDYSDLRSLPNYNPSTTQTLKHVNGVLQWG